MTEKTLIIILVLGLVMAMVGDGLLLWEYGHTKEQIARTGFTGRVSGKLVSRLLAAAQGFLGGLNKTTVILVGDIMLDRGVEWQIQKAGDWTYPFQKTALFLERADITAGNLEGPIVDNPPYFPDQSLRFAFSEKAVRGLKRADFNLLSLANNHTFNMLAAGLAETKKILKESQIAFVGDPHSCAQDYMVEKKGLVFIAFNKTFPFNCSDEVLVGIIKETRREHPNEFLIVLFHWGQEYAPKSSDSQQALAHRAIEAGADLIVGAHPHVVQEIERYKNGLIFYSLGNFVFDQDFSEPTQQGLAIKIELSPERAVYSLFPVQIQKSQPALMQGPEKQEFLQGLALKSRPQTPSFILQLKNGRVVTRRVVTAVVKDL